jgi:hypothetical protein
MTDEPSSEKKYRPPRTAREIELVEKFRRAGIELRIEDVRPGEHRLLFFGPVPDHGQGEEER